MKMFYRALAVSAFALVVSLWPALNLWGDDLIAYYIEPARPFDAQTPAKAPDYGEREYWAAIPGKSSAALLTPSGIHETEVPKDTDVFYIHPTSYISADSWNAPLFAETRAWEMVDIIMGAQASAFNLCCEIYAPHYRQAALSSFMNRDEESSRKALDLAYRDIVSAFEEFLEANGERPFIIASHSQGTYHALRLLSEHVDNQPLQQRMVAAYLIGYWVPEDTVGRTLKNIAPCEYAQDTGCLIHWSTYGESGERRNGIPHWYPTGTELVDGKELLCINPLNWEHNGGKEMASQHPGALYVAPGGSMLATLLNKPSDVKLETLPPLLDNWTWAECRDGLLHVADQVEGPFERLGEDPAQDYHLGDYSLFYESIRQNAVTRAQQFEKQVVAKR